ncbi:MAG: hypothetical protein ACJ76Z_11915 [Thermoleophilaceae bacterium]
MTTDQKRRRGHDRTHERLSTEEALRRLAEKKVEPTYRAPRGNQELDEDMTASSVSRWELILGG